MRHIRRGFAPGSGTARLTLASTLAGAAGGLIGTAYLAVLAAAERLLWPDHWARLPHLGILVATGAAIGVLLAVLGDPGETGVLIDSVHVAGGPPRLRPLVSLVPVSLLGIAAGGGIGPEPPLMQTTGTIGTWLGRRLRLTTTDLRVLTVTGMATGLTVLFAAPLGAAVLALEILHRKGLEYYEAVLPACAGSLAGYGVYVTLTGRGLAPAWQVGAAVVRLQPVDLPLGVAAGLGGALVAHLFGLLLRASRGLAGRLPAWARPPAAGLVLGALAFGFPDGLTFGESQVAGWVRAPGMAASVLVLAGAGHLLSAAVALAGRWKGGIIIPLFLVGYCLGQATAAWTGLGSHQLVLATSLMVACNVGVTKTPLGSTLVVAQLTGVRVLPPMLLAALVSLALTTRVTFVGAQRSRDLPPARTPGPPHLTKHTKADKRLSA